MADLPEFQRKQYAFAAHIRDPDHQPAPGQIEDRRMAIYRRLFFNNLVTLLGGTFPVLKHLCGPAGWRRLVRAFMVRHRARTPYFPELPREFVAFLEQEHQPTDEDFPFLAELAHYEWVELALSMAQDDDDRSSIDADGDLLEQVPVRSALAWSFSYRFPVHRISPSFKPAAPGDRPTHLVIYRRDDDTLGFMELNEITARLLSMIGDNDVETGRELLGRLGAEMHYPDPDALVVHGARALAEMRDAGILLGARRPG